MVGWSANLHRENHHLRFARQQLVFNYGNLGIDHAVKIELTAPSEGKMFRLLEMVR